LLTIAPGATQTITSSLLSATDNVSSAGQLHFAVTIAPTRGTLLLNGSATSSFTQADINNGLVSYHETASGVTSDNFHFTVTDAAGNAIGAAAFFINVDNPPQINLPSGASVAATSSEVFPFSSLFSGSDAENDPLTYLLYDSTAAANSGHFTVNGSIVPAQTIYAVSAAQLAQTTFVAGASGTSDDLYVEAYDGHAYSGWNAHVNVAVANNPPQVSLPSGANVSATAGQSLQASSLFSGSDANNDPLIYLLYDNTLAADSGHFVVNGTNVPAQTIYTVSAAQLAQTTFLAGASGTSDDLYVEAFDGQAYSGWNAHVNVAVAQNTPPQISLPSGSSVTASSSEVFQFSSLFSGSDANNDLLTYLLYDNTPAATSGHFVVNGTIVPALTIYTVSAAQLAQTTFVAGASGTSDDLYVEAFDGQAYSGWNAHVNVAVAQNATPQISLPSGTAVPATAGQSLSTSSLFIGSDANNDALTYYVYDSNSAANSGHFMVGATEMPAQTITEVSAAHLALTTFVAGAAGTTDYLYAEVFDGHTYSGWTEFHVFV
jgi:hypothetical protein